MIPLNLGSKEDQSKMDFRVVGLITYDCWFSWFPGIFISLVLSSDLQYLRRREVFQTDHERIQRQRFYFHLRVNPLVAFLLRQHPL